MTILLVFIYITALDNLYRKKILTSIGIDAINDFVNKHPQSYSNTFSKKGISRGAISDYEVSNWFNIITGAIWNIEGANEVGGCGPYLAKSIEQSLNIELARVPPGIAKLQLKNFNLGTKSPIIRALKVTPYRIPDSVCTKVPIKNMNNKVIGGELWKWYEKLNKNRNDKDTIIKGCEHLIIEIDVGYVSKEMDIILSLRSNDINSVLPEASVTVSTLAMSGILTLDSELIPEYPFFGNATFSFKELPKLEMTLSSFGGVDLSAIPGVRNFIDISLKWLISQYTNPNVGTINMISYICPSCLKTEPELNYIEKTVKFAKLLYSYLQQKSFFKNRK
jgi:Ca2+-dependent lipid-binding protein